MNINERNALALAQAIEDVTTKVRMVQVRMDGLIATLGTLSGRLDVLERLVGLAHARRLGHGPTET